ncbi:MAG: hypothetical protein L0154_26110 [Chloroflexi bacterium]|nr:hypothetical protein [Chloroflexota bacterium]
MRWLFLLTMMVMLVAPTTAQEGQEELFERFVVGIEREEIYFSYASLVQIDFNVSFTVFIDGEESFTGSERTQTITDGYIIRSRSEESRAGTVDIVYDYRAPEDNRAFHLLADMIFTDGMLYVDADYLEVNGRAPSLEIGWQSYNSFDVVPEPIRLVDLPAVFMLETSIFQAQDLLVDVVDRVEQQETQLVDGTPVDEITMWVDEEELDAFFSVLISDTDPDEELLRILMEHDDFSGEIFMVARFDDDDDILETDLELRLTMDNIPLEIVDATAPEGGTMNLVIEFSQYGIRDSINTEFAPIEPPIDG